MMPRTIVTIAWMAFIAAVTIAEMYGQTASMTAWMAVMVELKISSMTGRTVPMIVWITVRTPVMTSWITGMFAVMRSVTCWMIGQSVVVITSAIWPTASIIVLMIGTSPDTMAAITGATAATRPPSASAKLFTTITAAAKRPWSGSASPVSDWNAGASDDAMLDAMPMIWFRNASLVAML